MSGITLGTLLTPAAAGILLFALTAAPDQYREPWLQTLRHQVSGNTIARGTTALKWLLAYGVVRNISAFLSGIAQNNFRLRSERDKYDWPNEVAVVTGAASGFGALISKGLAGKDINVMALDITDQLPEDMRNNPKIHYYRCDVTDPEAVKDVATRIRTEHSPPSILINNAGIVFNSGILDCKPESLHKIFNVNVLSHYFTLQAFLPDMIAKHKGHIVTLASMASFTASPSIVPYSQTKAAVLAMHEGLGKELRTIYKAPEIKLTCVHPIFAATPLIAAFEKDLRAAGLPIIEPETVADAIIKQILSGTGRQILLAGGLEFVISNFRSFPHWLREGIFWFDESKKKTRDLVESNSGKKD